MKLPEKEQDAENDEELEEERLTSVSQIIPSRVTNKTFISELQHQLEEERAARMKIEGELESLKKASEEISSHLSQI